MFFFLKKQTNRVGWHAQMHWGTGMDQCEKTPGAEGRNRENNTSLAAASVTLHRTVAPHPSLSSKLPPRPRALPFRAAFALPSPLRFRFRHGPARLPLLAPLPPPLCAATDAAPSPPAQTRLPRRARRSRESGKLLPPNSSPVSSSILYFDRLLCGGIWDSLCESWVWEVRWRH
jgi:hypothetical protein